MNRMKKIFFLLIRSLNSWIKCIVEINNTVSQFPLLKFFKIIQKIVVYVAKTSL